MSASESTSAKYVDPIKALWMNILTGVFACGIGVFFFFCFWPLGLFFVVTGLVAPFVLFFIKNLEGSCPHCGHTITVRETKPGVTCRACKKRIVVREMRFLRVD